MLFLLVGFNLKYRMMEVENHHWYRSVDRKLMKNRIYIYIVSKYILQVTDFKEENNNFAVK